MSRADDIATGVIIGVTITTTIGIVVAGLAGPPLGSAQDDYLRCITDGAPKERCIEIYLLPKEREGHDAPAQ